MNLESYKKLVELQMYSDGTLHQIQEAKKNYENNIIDQEFENIKRFNPIIQSNKELIDRIEKKSDKNDEFIKNISDALPYYNQNVQQKEPLILDDKTTPKEETQSTPKEETQSTPKEETQSTPKEETQSTPKEETQSTPKEETQSTPKEETQSTPKEETQSTPKEETQSTPKEETQSTPKEETQSTPKEETQSTPKEETQSTRILSLKNIFDNDAEIKFINDLMDGKKVHLYDNTQPKSDDLIPVYSDIKLLDLDKLPNYSNEEIDKFLSSSQLTSLTKN